MKFYHNYQNNIKRKHCDCVFIVLENNFGVILKKCIKCFRIIEEGLFDY